MASVSDFYSGIQDAINNAVSRLKPYRAAVDSTSSGLVKIQPLESPTPLAEGFARLTGTKLESGDEVAVLDLSGKPFVLGKIQRSSSLGEGFDFPIFIEADNDHAFEVNDGSATTLRVDTDSSKVAIVNGASLSGYSGESSAGSGTFNLNAANGNASLGSVTATSFNSPAFTRFSQNSADTASTTSTTTLQTAGSTTLSLPAGTWTVHAIGGCQFIHSASGTVVYQITIGGTGGAARSMTFNNTVYGMGVDDASVSGLSGNVTVSVEYRCSTAGTTSARNPWLFIAAVRTS